MVTIRIFTSCVLDCTNSSAMWVTTNYRTDCKNIMCLSFADDPLLLRLERRTGVVWRTRASQQVNGGASEQSRRLQTTIDEHVSHRAISWRHAEDIDRHRNQPLGCWIPQHSWRRSPEVGRLQRCNRRLSTSSGQDWPQRRRSSLCWRTKTAAAHLQRLCGRMLHKRLWPGPDCALVNHFVNERRLWCRFFQVSTKKRSFCSTKR